MKLEVTVRVEDDRKADLQKVVEELQMAGLSNVSCTRRFGIVHGEIESSGQDALKNVDGVASVRLSDSFHAL